MKLSSSFFNLLKDNKKNEPVNDGANSMDKHFENLITESNFPGYTIERNVHVSVFNSLAHPCCYPISYLIKRNGKPVLAVFLMNRNQYRSMIARGSYAVLEEAKIPRINFYRDFENEENYVLNRIRENLI
jgi:hypothetical protein